MGMSKDLIAQTIKANALHIAANLADEAFDNDYLFADQQRNPFGRLLSVIGMVFEDYEELLSDLEDLTDEEKDEQYPFIISGNIS